MQSDIQTSTTTLNAAGQASDGVLVKGAFLVLVKGAFNGSLTLQRRIAGSNDVTDFLPVMIDTLGSAVAITRPGVYAFDEPAIRGAEYRIVASALANGTPRVSFDQ